LVEEEEEVVNPDTNIEKTEILYGANHVMNILLQFLSKANRIDSCGDNKAPLLTIEVKEYRGLLFDLKKRNTKLRYLTEITEENIRHCRELMKFVDEIRHLDGIKANFSVSDTEYIAYAAAAATTPIHKEPQSVQQLIYSNVKDLVQQQKYVFETFWSKAIPAEQRIKEIEEGIVLGSTEIIQNPLKIKELLSNLIESATEEILLILPTTNAFIRKERIGIIQLLKQVAEGERKVNVRILTPTNDIVEKIIHTILGKSNDGQTEKPPNIRRIEEPSERTISTVTIVVIDKRESLVIEKTDDLKDDFIEAVGIATYSNSKPTVLSYISIFESLWNEAKLYEQLKIHDKMQREFINIASHEMKTPTQAILGYSDLVQKHPEKREEMLNAISRNAIRLQKLTNDILDVTRIESQTLNLNKENFDLIDLIGNIVEDYRSQIEKDNNNFNLELLYNKPSVNSFLIVEADRERVSQVISNLLNNAIKFTKQGVISITAIEEKGSNEVIVKVQDTGQGIDSGILPRLFTKFATKSFTGTGLGLFISKSIIEAHGGMMWAENNPDGKGANFAFTLPLRKQNSSSRAIEYTE
jgi:nitrogen-specific signal transduction histidine kinase